MARADQGCASITRRVIDRRHHGRDVHPVGDRRAEVGPRASPASPVLMPNRHPTLPGVTVSIHPALLAMRIAILKAGLAIKRGKNDQRMIWDDMAVAGEFVVTLRSAISARFSPNHGCCRPACHSARRQRRADQRSFAEAEPTSNSFWTSRSTKACASSPPTAWRREPTRHHG